MKTILRMSSLLLISFVAVAAEQQPIQVPVAHAVLAFAAVVAHNGQAEQQQISMDKKHQGKVKQCNVGGKPSKQARPLARRLCLKKH